VVLDGGRIAAVLDDRMVASEWPAGGPDAPHRRRVGDVVERGVRCVLPEASVAQVARVMVETNRDAVPVVTAAGSLVGLATSTDLVAALAAGPATASPAGWHDDDCG